MRAAVLLVLCVLPAAACSSFERDWRAMARGTEPDTGLEGRWDGTWLSAANGHTGRLRCIVTPAPDGTLHAWYRAGWGWGFNFEYTVPLDVRRDGDAYRFDAEADLGWLAGGRYTYLGSVTGDAFSATYACTRDHGTFEMTRVRGDPAPD